MKSRSIRMALLSGLVLTSPLLTFAAGQPKVRSLSPSEMQHPDGITRAVQQGKGGGMSRNQVALPARTNHLQTAPDWSDSAFRK